MKRKSKRSRFMVLWLAVMMALALSLSGCGKGDDNVAPGATPAPASSAPAIEEEQPVEQEVVELQAYFPGDTPIGFEEVILAVNDKLKKDNIGASLKIQFVPWSDYGDKTTLMMTAGDDFDMYLDAPWMHLNQVISNGSVAALDDYVKNSPNLLNSIPQQMWEANKFNGKIYGIPLGVVQDQLRGFLIRKDLRVKYGLAELKTLDDMEKFLYKVKENEKDIIPFGDNGSAMELFKMLFNPAYYTTDSLENYGIFGVPVVYGTHDGKAVPYWEMPGYVDVWKKMTQYFKDGIFAKNIAQEKNFAALFNQGKFAATSYYSDGVSGMSHLDAYKLPGTEWEIVMLYNEGIKPISNFKQWNFLCVNAKSNHKELVIKVMDWLSIQENHDLLEYGIEGKDWQAVGSDQYHTLSKYAFPGYVMTWRPTLAKSPDAMLPDDKKWYDMSRDANNFVPSRYMGFSANIDAVKTEVAKLNTVKTDILDPMDGGVLPFDQGLIKLKDASDKAGIQKVMEEIQRQFDEFKSKK